MYRISVDGNETTHDGFALWQSKSKLDLAKITSGPKEDMLVTIYEVGDYEAEATLHWCVELNTWTARQVGPLRDNHETWDDEAHRS
jgi:hypothetical protein